MNPWTALVDLIGWVLVGCLLLAVALPVLAVLLAVVAYFWVGFISWLDDIRWKRRVNNLFKNKR